MNCEKLHLFALKKFLGVAKQTPNDLVYGELNRYPIYLLSAVKCIRYWLKVIQMEEHRLPFKAYKMLFDLDAKGKKNWATGVRLKLYQYGFGEVWVNQSVGDSKVFINVFRQRLIDCRWQEWTSHVEESNRFSLYRLININHVMPEYMSNNLNREMKRIVSKFRFGVSDLAIHRNRYNPASCMSSFCPSCLDTNTDEVHFVFVCPMLSDIRKQCIPSKFCKHPCLFKLVLLLSSTNEVVVKNLAVFLYKSFKLLNIAMS